MATSGPGATNLVTGIATAYMDSSSGGSHYCQRGQYRLLGQDSFQEIDIAGVTMPITKHNFIVKDVTQLAEYHPQSVLHCQKKDVQARFWWTLPRM